MQLPCVGMNLSLIKVRKLYYLLPRPEDHNQRMCLAAPVPDTEGGQGSANSQTWREAVGTGGSLTQTRSTTPMKSGIGKDIHQENVHASCSIYYS